MPDRDGVRGERSPWLEALRRRPPGGYIEECADAWGTRVGSGYWGPVSTVTWASYSWGGNCNNLLNVQPYRLRAVAVGYSTTWTVLCYRVKVNTTTVSDISVQAGCSTTPPNANHETEYYWTDGSFLGGGMFYT